MQANEKNMIALKAFIHGAGSGRVVLERADFSYLLGDVGIVRLRQSRAQQDNCDSDNGADAND